MKDLDFITLSDQEGNETEFEVLTTLIIEDIEKKYVVVIPKDLNDEDEVEPIALRIEENDDEEMIFLPVEDEEEFEMVSEAFELTYGAE